MRRTRSAPTPFVAVTLVAVVAALVFLLHKQGLDRSAQWVTVLGFPVALFGLYLTWRSSRRRPEFFGVERMDREVDNLAAAVRSRLHDEERLRRLQDPVPIPVCWANAPAGSDHWTNIGAPGGLDLSGSIEDVAKVFARIPSSRLVVLGDAGAGKSVLVGRLALDVLRSRQPADPVPIVIPIAGWNPTQQGIHAFAAERLVSERPTLARKDREGKSLALALLETGRILLLLDGLDEMPELWRPYVFTGLNRVLNRNDGVVLTSRPTEYRRAVTSGRVLRKAAAVDLKPLTSADLRAYLPRTIGPDPVQDKWKPVLDSLERSEHLVRFRRALARLTNEPGAETQQFLGHPVAQALSTPLMTSLARTVYSDTGADPAELLDRERFPDRRSVEHHLLDAFIPAVYDRPPGAGPPQRWTSVQARNWLGRLADRLDSEGTTDIAWWRIGEKEGRIPWLVVSGLLFCGMLAVLAGLGLTMPAYGLPIPVWLFLGLALAIPYGYLAWRDALDLPDPCRFRISARRLLWTVPSALAYVAGAGFMGWVILASGFSLPAMLVPLVVAARALHTLADEEIVGGLTPRAEVTEAKSPRALHRGDRRVTFLLAPLFGLQALTTYALLLPWLIYLAWALNVDTPSTDGVQLQATVADPTPLAVAAGLAGATAYLVGILATAWGRSLLARLALATTGRAPLALVAFLEDAHQKGVLRQAGGVYHFRHAELQQRLRTRSSKAADKPAKAVSPRFKRIRILGVAIIVVLGIVGGGLSLGLVTQPGAPGPYETYHSPCKLMEQGAIEAPFPGRVDKGYPPAYAQGDFEPLFPGTARSGPPDHECRWEPRDDSAFPTSDLFITVTIYPPDPPLRSAVSKAEMAYLPLVEPDGWRPVTGLGDEAAESSGATGYESRVVVRHQNMLLELNLIYFHPPHFRLHAKEAAQVLARDVLVALGGPDVVDPAAEGNRVSLRDLSEVLAQP